MFNQPAFHFFKKIKVRGDNIRGVWWLKDSSERVIATKVTYHSGNVGTRIVDMQYQLPLTRFLAQRRIAPLKIASFDQ
jgi:hypothetical protein